MLLCPINKVHPPINISYSPCSSSSKLSHKQMAVGMLTSFFYFNRFKDRNFNIVFATGCWIFASPSTWSSRCRQGKYKLQSSWPSFGMCLSSCAQFFILYSCMTSTEYFFTLHQKVYLAFLKREVIICCKDQIWEIFATPGNFFFYYYYFFCSPKIVDCKL